VLQLEWWMGVILGLENYNTRNKTLLIISLSYVNWMKPTKKSASNAVCDFPQKTLWRTIKTVTSRLNYKKLMEFPLLKAQGYALVSSGSELLTRTNLRMIGFRFRSWGGPSILPIVFFVAPFWLCNLSIINGYLLMLRL
jgi:hypothetical protein